MTIPQSDADLIQEARDLHVFNDVGYVIELANILADRLSTLSSERGGGAIAAPSLSATAEADGAHVTPAPSHTLAGYKLVPVEATEEMLDAADEPFHAAVKWSRNWNVQCGREPDGGFASAAFSKSMWGAMVAAAPTPETGAEAQGGDDERFDLDAPYQPTPINFSDPLRVEYIAADVPGVRRRVDDNLDVILDMEKRSPIGFCLHGYQIAAAPLPPIGDGWLPMPARPKFERPYPFDGGDVQVWSPHGHGQLIVSWVDRWMTPQGPIDGWLTLDGPIYGSVFTHYRPLPAPPTGAAADGPITSHPDIMDGEPCIAGTRIPPRCVQSLHVAGYLHEAIRQEYPTLTDRQIDDALRYRP